MFDELRWIKWLWVIEYLAEVWVGRVFVAWFSACSVLSLLSRFQDIVAVSTRAVWEQGMESFISSAMIGSFTHVSAIKVCVVNPFKLGPILSCREPDLSQLESIDDGRDENRSRSCVKVQVGHDLVIVVKSRQPTWSREKEEWARQQDGPDT